MPMSPSGGTDVHPDRHRVDKVKELIEAEGNPELVLRVAVRPGGCSGLSYEMFFDTDVAADDIAASTAESRSWSTPRARST